VVGSTFVERYEEWSQSAGASKDDLERMLAIEYRSAWMSGSAAVRKSVLYYIVQSRDSSGYDLLDEGLHSDDRDIAVLSAAIAAALADDGIELSRATLERLRNASERFPEAEPYWWATRNSVGDRTG
jgi:hypothetical protein